MGSISHHITPLAINSLGGGYTHKHTHIQTSTQKQFQETGRSPGLIKVVDYQLHTLVTGRTFDKSYKLVIIGIRKLK